MEKIYVKDRPDYMLDWDYELNDAAGIFPDEVTAMSRKRVYWKCHICGGKFDTIIKERRGCPYCTGFKALEGFNDITTTNPELVKEWCFDKNNILPRDVTAGSQKKVFWVCNKGHIWDAPIRSRVRGQGCPYCANKRVLEGYNDLATTNSELLDEWNWKKMI